MKRLFKVIEKIHKLTYWICSFESRRKQMILFISGSQRSGTTWIQEYICQVCGRSRSMFEPFHPTRSAAFALIGMSNAESRRRIIEVTSGRVNSPWISNIPTDKFFFTCHRIIKCVSISHYIDQICDLFPSNIVIHISRDPLAVATGRMATDFPFPSVVFFDAMKFLGFATEKKSLSEFQKLYCYLVVDNLVACAKGKGRDNFFYLRLEDLMKDITIVEKILKEKNIQLSNAKDYFERPSKSKQHTKYARYKLTEVEMNFKNKVDDIFGINYEQKGYPLLSRRRLDQRKEKLVEFLETL